LQLTWTLEVVKEIADRLGWEQGFPQAGKPAPPAAAISKKPLSSKDLPVPVIGGKFLFLKYRSLATGHSIPGVNLLVSAE
jgi:hypothetical protein